MASIDFRPTLGWTSDLLDVRLNLKFQEWDIFPGTDATLTYDTVASTLNIKTVTCTPVEGTEISYPAPTLTARIPVGHLHTVFSEVGVTKQLYRLCLAAGENESLYITANLACTNRSSNDIRCSITVYLEHIVNGVTTTEQVYQNAQTSIRTDRSASYNYGISFVAIPGRDNQDPTTYAMVFFRGYENGNNTDLDVPFPIHISTQSGEITQYNLLYTTNVNVTNGQIVKMFSIDLARIPLVFTGLSPAVEIFSPEAGPESEQDGMENPSFDNTSDTVSVPAVPTTELVNMGFYHIYKMSASSLNNLATFVFGEEPDGVLDTLLSIGKNMFRSRMVDYIVSCHTIPVDPSVNATGLMTVKLGGRNLSDGSTSVSGVAVTSDYVDFDCGSISLPEYYENFADFLENCKLYLPFIGFVPARPEWFKNTSLGVKYRFNVIDGSCVAFVLSTGRYVNGNNSGGTIVGQYSGTASIRFPVTGLSFAGMATGVVGAVGGMATAVGAGSLLGVAGSAVNMAQARPDIAQSNGYNACAAMMGVRRPYLYIERPVSSYARNYQHELGIPSNIYGSLGSCVGFVSMVNVHLDGIDLTEAEKNELQSLLSSGVIN